MQGVRHRKPTEVVDEVKAQLKEKVQPAGNPLADVIVAAGKDKLSKKPEDIQTDLTSERTPHSFFDTPHDGILLAQALEKNELQSKMSVEFGKLHLLCICTDMHARTGRKYLC